MIPFNKPYIPEDSYKYLSEALASLHHQGDGPLSKFAEKEISRLVGGGTTFLTPSCTHALELASMLCNLKPGDEVIMPSFTFTSAATAVTKFGATPVFADINAENRCIEVDQIEKLISKNTVAISWVNYAGHTPNIDKLLEIKEKYNLILIEDNAHSLGGMYKNKPLGSFGDFATQSFHATKNLQCGEGGAIVINNSKFIERAEFIREKGTNRTNFSKGLIEKYEWIELGSSYLLPEILSGLLLGQLLNFEKIKKSRMKIWQKYSYEFERFRGKSNLKPMEILSENNNIAHMFYLLTEDQNHRDRIINNLKKNSIQAVFHYQSLHSSIAGKRFGKSHQNLSNSDSLSKSLIRMPFWVGLDEESISEIVEIVIQS